MYILTWLHQFLTSLYHIYWTLETFLEFVLQGFLVKAYSQVMVPKNQNSWLWMTHIHKMKTAFASKMVYLLWDWKYCISIIEISTSEEAKNFANLNIYRSLFRPNFG